jgi:acetyltransferase-like isoleucine patch superfamily enzyme
MRFDQWERPEIIHNVPTKWNWVVAYPENLILGDKVDIGAFCYLQARYGIEIGDNVQLGGGVKVYSENSIDGTFGKVTIKDGACVGANSVVLPGVTIGKNAVVGALSLVKHNVSDNAKIWGVI